MTVNEKSPKVEQLTILCSPCSTYFLGEKMKKAIFLVLLMMTCSMFAKSIAESTNKPSPIPNTTETMLVSPGQKEIVISIQANPTTGYLWTVSKYNDVYLDLVGKGFIKAKNSRLIGAPGHNQFIFKVLKPIKGTLRISLELKRPWEKVPVAKKTYMINLLSETINPAE